MSTIWTYLGIYVKYLILLSDFNQIWTSLTDFCKYQISQKSAQWQPQWYMWADRHMDTHDEANRSFSLSMQISLNMGTSAYAYSHWPITYCFMNIPRLAYVTIQWVAMSSCRTVPHFCTINASFIHCFVLCDTDKIKSNFLERIILHSMKQGIAAKFCDVS